MEKIVRLLALSFVVASASVAHATADSVPVVPPIDPTSFLRVVTFESWGGLGNPVLSGTNSVEGLDFTSDHFHIIDTPESCAFGGCVTSPGRGKYLALDAPGLGKPVTITKTGGGTFSILRLTAGERLFGDSAAAAAGGFPNADHLHLLGNYSGGGTVTADIDIRFCTGCLYDLTGFNDLDSVVISGFVTGGTANASWAVDDIVFSTPEPSSLILLSIAFIGLACCRRTSI